MFEFTFYWVSTYCFFFSYLFKSLIDICIYWQDAGAGLVAAAMISIVPGTMVSVVLFKETSKLWDHLKIKETSQNFFCFVLIIVLIVFFSGYISRSVAGSYDNEGIAIFCMLLTYALWIKSVKTGSLFWSTMCALAYFYMVSELNATFVIIIYLLTSLLMCSKGSLCVWSQVTYLFLETKS